MRDSEIFTNGSQAQTVNEPIDVREKYLHYLSSANSVYLADRYMVALKDFFMEMRNIWLSNIQYNSSIYSTTKHPAYQKIIHLGNEVIPLLLLDMVENNTHWFLALIELTGENPIKPENRGNIKAMINDWVLWGHRMNYI